MYYKSICNIRTPKVGLESHFEHELWQCENHFQFQLWHVFFKAEDYLLEWNKSAFFQPAQAPLVTEHFETKRYFSKVFPHWNPLCVLYFFGSAVSFFVFVFPGIFSSNFKSVAFLLCAKTDSNANLMCKLLKSLQKNPLN